MIDTNAFKYENSRLKDLYKFLKSKGYSVYWPAQHQGDCTSTYIVIKYNGTSGQLANISSRADIYSLLCYVPFNQYSYIEEYVQKVKADMKELEPLFLVYGDQQLPAYFDDANNGHYVEIDYKNYKSD